MAVSGVQFDKMKVSPEQDALLYQHLSGESNRVINGYKNSLKVSSSGLNIYIETGAALIQGRLVTVDELEKLTVEANTSGYVCLTIDLTQTNTSSGTPGLADYSPENKQVRAEILGSLIQQDLKNDGKIFTFPLATYQASGTSVSVERIKSNYENDDIISDWITLPILNGYNASARVRKHHGFTDFDFSIAGNQPQGANDSNIFVAIPEEYIKSTQAMTYIIGDNSIHGIVTIRMTGAGKVYLLQATNPKAEITGTISFPRV